MGSIYKRTRKRPIPAGATIVTKRGKELVEWTGKDGRLHRAKLTEDGQKIEVESKTYYIKYRDENDIQQAENSNASDKDTAQQILNAREKRVAAIRGGIVDPAAQRLQDAATKPIARHIEDFHNFMANKGGDPKHVKQTIRYIVRLVDYIGAGFYSDLTAEEILGALRYIQTEKIKSRRGCDTRGPRTANAYLVAIKSFCGWMVKTKRSPSNPAQTLDKFTETNDRRHERRAMTNEEFIKLLEAAYNSPDMAQGVDGPTRATIYLTAALTGLRRKELASLTRSDFRLDDSEPIVIICNSQYLT